ncbi:helix-turn-helix transcriptional regulator [Neomoorella glycerini]|nr:helix-turn-helix transcriptional regulator [Moorella glycerini]
MKNMRVELFKARKAKGLTQEKVALAVGIDRTVYTRIERGVRIPTVDVAIKIASLLGKQVEEIFLLENVHETHNFIGTLIPSGTEGK